MCKETLRLILLTYNFICILSPLFSQGYDRFWITGYDYWHVVSIDTNFGGSYIDFNEEPPRLLYDPNHTMNFWGTASSISNVQGELLFYTNGMTIHDAHHEVVKGADTIAYGSYWEAHKVNGLLGGSNLIQGAFFLPDPSGNAEEYWLCYTKADIMDPVIYEMSDVLFSRVKRINGNWEAVVKDQLILHDTLSNGQMAVCKHANGRDWWLLIGEKNSNAYYSILIDPTGFHIIDKQVIDSPVNTGVGQAGFANNGNTYFRFEGYSFSDDGGELHVYDFDRCNGKLSNHRWWKHPVYSICGANASLQSRYLYTTDALNVYQWDLQATDIESSRVIVATYDGFVDESGFETYFSFINEGPDGRLYIIPPSGGSKYFHSIEFPNLHGLNCKVIQHKIHLPTWNQRTVPMLPNYKLGPLDGSMCDSLNIDNKPIANFRVEMDGHFINKYEFIDFSYFDPKSWHWDFGDGATSFEQNPIHDYGQSGDYDVCLTVQNPFGTNMKCLSIHVEISTAVLNLPEPELKGLPNPFDNHIQFNPSAPGSYKIEIFNFTGSKIVDIEMSCPCSIITSTFAPGIYIYQISNDANKTVGRLLKINSH